MVEATAKQRMTRALESKTRPSIELQELKIHDQVDFYRPPETKDESGWKGPAELIEILDGAATVRWQRQHLRVRAQDLRRSLAFVYLLCLHFTSDWARRSPADTVIEFAEACQRRVIRIGWVNTAVGWRQAAANRDYGELLLAALYVASCSVHLTGYTRSNTYRHTAG